MDTIPSRYQSPAPDPVDPDATLPDDADVVVVGAGIAGASTAYFLAKSGIRTVLCDKGIVAGEQSSRNWGWVRKMHRDPRELPLMMESMRIWQGLDEALGAETGFRRSGIAYLCKTRDEVARYEGWLAETRSFDLDSRLLSHQEIETVVPGCRGSWSAALYTASDGRAEPEKAVPAIARGAQSHGAVVLTNCAVRGVELARGRVAAVVTERGRIGCQSAVIAAGAWSGLMCRHLGLRFPQLKVLASVLRIQPFDGGPETAAWGGEFAFRKRLDGGYTVANGGWNDVDLVPDSFRFAREFLPALRNEWSGLRFHVGKKFLEEVRLSKTWKLDEITPFERVRILDPEPSRAALRAAYSALGNAVPIFQNKSVEQCWAGVIDATPDALPVISEIASRPGLYLISGFSGHGFGIGPGAGRLMADLVLGNKPLVEPMPFRFSRFHDGTKLRPMSRSV